MKYFPLIALMLFIFSPESVSAAFIPCDGAGVNGLTACTECHFVQIGNSILKWLIGVLFVVFAVVAAIGGFGLVTSGGNPSAKQDAKNKMINALIGLVIVLGAWLLVDTIMRGLLVGGEGEISTEWGIWSKVECGTQFASEVAPTVDLATACSGACVPLGSVPCKDPSSCSIAASMQSKLEQFHADAGVTGARVTEAMPPTRVHSNPCHTNGTCVDYGVAGGITDIDDINKVINAAVANGLTPKYEVGTAAEVEALIAGGVPAKFIEKPLGDWITAPHFSIYGN